MKRCSRVSSRASGGTGAGGTTSEIFVYLNGSPEGAHNSFTIGETAAVPLPSAASAGMIGLQSEGTAIDFRNLTLKLLPPAKDLHAPMPPGKS